MKFCFFHVSDLETKYLNSFLIQEAVTISTLPPSSSPLVTQSPTTTSTTTEPPLPHNRTLYIVTPTYPRSEQVAELTRLGQTLKLVPDLLWLVVEDATTRTKAVEKLLARLQIPYVHMTGRPTSLVEHDELVVM